MTEVLPLLNKHKIINQYKNLLNNEKLFNYLSLFCNGFFSSTETKYVAVIYKTISDILPTSADSKGYVITISASVASQCNMLRW